jgi:hypothetical protein
MAAIPLNRPSSGRQPKAVPVRVRTLKPIPAPARAKPLKVTGRDPRRKRRR